MKRTVKLDGFLQQAPGYKQFTIDFIEGLHGRIEEFQRESHLAEADFFHAVHYEVDNILEIMEHGLKDREFFTELKSLLNNLAEAADSTTRRGRMASRAPLN